MMVKRNIFGKLLAVISLMSWTAACGAADPIAAMATNSARTLEENLQDNVSSLSGTLARVADRDALKAFYESRQYRPLWVDEAGPTRAALRVIAELESAEDWGLETQGMTHGSVHKLPKDGRWSAAEAATAEFEISAAILLYARQARGGRISEPARMLSTYLDRLPVMLDPSAILAEIATASEPDRVLRSFHPQHEQFHKLQKIYARLLAKQKSADVAGTIPVKGPLLMPGQRHPSIAALRRRLGVPAVNGDIEFYDDALAVAVEKFQEAEDLKADGTIGVKTRKALNAGAAHKLRSIRANMEQWRWMPEDLGSTHVFVNLPAFKVKLVQNGAVTLEERVIAGKSTTQTPVFSRNLKSVVLKPSWQLPESIKVEKLIDAQKRGSSIEDEGYVIKKGEKTVKSRTVDWSKANLTAYTFFQPSGDGNALGKVKFLFPNKHSVYLHDTPNKALFDSSERLFSHGCVRLRNPLVLAQRLLDIAHGEGAVDVKESVKAGPGNNVVTLDNPIPIHLGYFTVWAGENGEAEYHGDPYGHEERIALALEKNWEEIDKGGDHLAAVDTQELKKVRLESLAKAVDRPVRTDVAANLPKRSWAPAMGVTQVFGIPKFKSESSYGGFRSRRVTAGDLMRQAFGR